MSAIEVARWSELREAAPVAARALDVELVVVRLEGAVHVLYARCPHRGAHLVGATVEAGCLVCPEHGWELRCATGESPTVPGEGVHRFRAWVDDDRVLVEAVELQRFEPEEPSYSL